MANETVRRIEETLAPLAAAHGLELWTVDVAGAARRPVVRVFLDREGGITLDEVSEANRWVAEALDELDVPAGPYTLEVSSPGIERTLRGPQDFTRYAGSRAEVKLREPRDGRKTFTGTISGATDDTVTLDVDGETVQLPYDMVSKARLRADFDLGDEGSGGKP